MTTQRVLISGPCRVLPRASGRLGFLVLLWLLLCAASAQAGTIVSASCPCGYVNAGMFLFGGKSNFRTVCYFPAWCKATGALVRVNVLDPKAASPGCPSGEVIPYENPMMRAGQGGEPIAFWRIPGRDRTLLLFADAYLCPRCHKHTLRFRVVGHWD